jgi:hypothetical protein
MFRERIPNDVPDELVQEYHKWSLNPARYELLHQVSYKILRNLLNLGEISEKQKETRAKDDKKASEKSQIFAARTKN